MSDGNRPGNKSRSRRGSRRGGGGGDFPREREARGERSGRRGGDGRSERGDRDRYEARADRDLDRDREPRSRDAEPENYRDERDARDRGAKPAASKERASSSESRAGEGFRDYIIEVRYDKSRGQFVGTVAELPDVQVTSRDRMTVLESLEDAIHDHLIALKQRGDQPPEPFFSRSYPSHLEVPVSQSLYRKLDRLSRRERVPLEKLVGELLSAAVERRAEKRPAQAQSQPQQREQGQSNKRGRGREKGRGGFNYHQTMESRESFLDYVRRLEKGRK